MVGQDLSQPNSQISAIIFLKEFIEFNVNTDMMIKSVKHVLLMWKYCHCFLEYTHFKDDWIEYKCWYTKKNYQGRFYKKLKERFLNTRSYSNRDNNTFILLLQKFDYPYIYPDKYIDDWEKINETSLAGKKYFYSHLNMEYISDTCYAHTKRVLKWKI